MRGQCGGRNKYASGTRGLERAHDCKSRRAMTIKLSRSTPATVTAVVAGVLFLVVTRAAYINTRTGLFPPSLTWLGYSLGLVLLCLCIITACFYARNLVLLGLGLVLCGLTYLLLNKLDPPLIVYELSKQRYEAEVAKSSAPDPKFIVFSLSEGYGFPAGAAWEYIVFDATDEIGLSGSRRTKEWEALHGGYVAPPNYQCTVTIRHLEGHFFYLRHRC